MSLVGQSPELGAGAFVAPSANVIGNVKIGAQSSVWYGAVIRGDVASISIGNNTNVQDNAIIHVTQHSKKANGPLPVHIGDNVTIGHAVTLHGCTIHNESLIGMGSTVMDGAVVEKNAIVAAGSCVTMNTVIPSGQVRVPANRVPASRPALSSPHNDVIRSPACPESSLIHPNYRRSPPSTTTLDPRPSTSATAQRRHLSAPEP